LKDREFSKAPLAVLLLLTVLGSALAFPPLQAFASTGCGATITANTILSADIGPCSGNGLVMGANHIVLDCAGHTIIGTGTNLTSVGITLAGMTEATVKNCKVTGFEYGFQLDSSSSNTLKENAANGNENYGFVLSRSSNNNTLTGNTAGQDSVGFYIESSSKNNLTGDVANSDSQYGFYIPSSSMSSYVKDAADGNGIDGFYLSGAIGNALTNDTASGNGFNGFDLETASDTTLTNNTSNSNGHGGFYLAGSDANTLAGNTASNNPGSLHYPGYDFYLNSTSHGNELGRNMAGGNSSSYFDSSTGLGTSGTANSYALNICNEDPSPPGLCLQTFIATNPLWGPTGSWITITGANFRPDHHLKFTSEGCNPACFSMPISTSCSTNSTGNINSRCFFIIPAQFLIAIAITATDGSFSASAAITVLPSISLSSTTGATGTSVAIGGADFQPSSNLTVTYDGSSQGMPTCSAGVSGTINPGCIFGVPPSPIGPNLIIVSNGIETAVSTFTVVSNPSSETVSCTTTTVSTASSKTVTCTATVSGYSPTGEVSWSQSGAGSVLIHATTCTLAQGSCSVTMTGSKPGIVTIKATYKGDSNNLGSSGAAKLTVVKATTVTAVSCTKSVFAKGASITCTATVTGLSSSHTGTIAWSKVSGTGKVTFSKTTCTPSAGKCSVTIKGIIAGSVTIEAAYSGDSNNLKSSGTKVLKLT
jgi:parallel beta-helix repeat protein